MKKSLAFMAFWAINDKPDIQRVERQLSEMKQLGFTGVIFHPRFYPGTPEYLSQEYMDILTEIILVAKKLALTFWLYDENGYPSGTASGKVLEQNPDAKCEWLEYRNGEVIFQSKNAVSTLDRKMCRDFVEITFEGYRKGLSKEAFDYVTGVFSDEVGFLDGHSVSFEHGGIPWCPELPVLYKEHYNDTLEDKLSLLFINQPGYEQVRENYWYLITSILRDNFYVQIGEWCAHNNKLYTAHLKGEENIFFNISYNGSPYQILKSVSVPAIDALERYPGNHYYPHIASSLAKQFSDGQCLCEAIGGSGWGLSPQEFMDYMCWLIDCGINMFTFHLSQYTLNAQAIRDWPPSLPFHVSWKEAFPDILQHIQEYKNQLDAKQCNREQILLVTPACGCIRQFLPSEVSGINEHNGAGVPDTIAGSISNQFITLVERCYEQGILYDVTEEKIIEEYGNISEKGLQLGNMCYSKVLLGADCHFSDKEILRKLEKFKLLTEKPTVTQPTETKQVPPQAETILENREPWIVTPTAQNQFLLELQKKNHGLLGTDITIHGAEHACDIILKCSDPVKQIIINGNIEPHMISADKQVICHISANRLKNGHLYVALLPYDKGEQNPFVFLQGDFYVLEQNGYIENGKGQLETKGDFVLSFSTRKLQAEDLITCGRPFAITPTTVYKEFLFPEEADSLLLTDVHAAAVKVSFGNQEPQWIFNTAKGIRIPQTIRGTQCKFSVELYPSTYNTYGPHHHIDGDRHLTSPDQYSGKKNFADFPDSPENTLVTEYHFVKFGIGANVYFKKSC